MITCHDVFDEIFHGRVNVKADPNSGAIGVNNDGFNNAKIFTNTKFQANNITRYKKLVDFQPCAANRKVVNLAGIPSIRVIVPPFNVYFFSRCAAIAVRENGSFIRHKVDYSTFGPIYLRPKAQDAWFSGKTLLEWPRLRRLYEESRNFFDVQRYSRRR